MVPPLDNKYYILSEQGVTNLVYHYNRTILTSRDMQVILAGLRSLDSVSGSRYYSQLMEKLQTGSSEFISGRDYILIDLSSWNKGSLAQKIEVIQSALRTGTF